MEDAPVTKEGLIAWAKTQAFGILVGIVVGALLGRLVGALFGF